MSIRLLKISLCLWILFGVFFLTANPVARAASSPDVSGLVSKMNSVLKGQEKILAELANIKKELQIVKIRATSH